VGGVGYWVRMNGKIHKIDLNLRYNVFIFIIFGVFYQICQFFFEGRKMRF
jgi:membrane associated rhomboid family serine protease